MSRAANCGLDQQLYPSQFYLNEVATNLATGFIVLTSLFYIINITALFLQVSAAQPHTQRQRKHTRSDLTVNSLSALLAAVFGIVVILATWPQPLEGAALLVIVLAQASVLGWQNHDPERCFKDLVEKIPDVAAVAVAAYALGDGRQKYLELNPENEFSYYHDPKYQMIFAFVLTGAGAITGVAQEILVSNVASPATKKKILQWCSFIFTTIQLATIGPAIGFGATTIADGCTLFNVTKVAAMLNLSIGIVYSISLWVMRLKLLPVG